MAAGHIRFLAFKTTGLNMEKLVRGACCSPMIDLTTEFIHNIKVTFVASSLFLQPELTCDWNDIERML
jgi:hypothetical protein